MGHMAVWDSGLRWGGSGSASVPTSRGLSNSPALPSQTWMSVHWAPTTALRLRPATTSRAASAACASSVRQTTSVSQKRECLQLCCGPAPSLPQCHRPSGKWPLPWPPPALPYKALEEIQRTVRVTRGLSPQREMFDLEPDVNDHGPRT